MEPTSQPSNANGEVWDGKTTDQRLFERYNCRECAGLMYRFMGSCATSDLDAFETHRSIHKKTHVGNGAYNGPFAFTITKSPKDALSVGDMLLAVRKVMAQTSCPVVKYAWFYEDKGRDEHGEPIHPHIHGMYETVTGGRIETKHWKRAWKIWDPNTPMGAGFRGGYHRPVRNGEGYAAYIKKDGGMSESRGFDDGQTE